MRNAFYSVWYCVRDRCWIRTVRPLQKLVYTTNLEIYTISIPAAQRKAVEKLSDLVTNGDELGQVGKRGGLGLWRSPGFPVAGYRPIRMG